MQINGETVYDCILYDLERTGSLDLKNRKKAISFHLLLLCRMDTSSLSLGALLRHLLIVLCAVLGLNDPRTTNTIGAVRDRITFISSRLPETTVIGHLIPITIQAESMFSRLFVDLSEDFASELTQANNNRPSVEYRRRVFFHGFVRAFNGFYRELQRLVERVDRPPPLSVPALSGYEARVDCLAFLGDTKGLPRFPNDNNIVDRLIEMTQQDLEEYSNGERFRLRYFGALPVSQVPFPSLERNKYSSAESQLIEAVSTSDVKEFTVENGDQRHSSKGGNLADETKAAISTIVLSDDGHEIPVQDEPPLDIIDEALKAAGIAGEEMDTSRPSQNLDMLPTIRVTTENARQLPETSRHLSEDIRTTLRMFSQPMASAAEISHFVTMVLDRIDEIRAELPGSSTSDQAGELLRAIQPLLNSAEAIIPSISQRWRDMEAAFIESDEQAQLQDIIQELIVDVMAPAVTSLRSYLSHMLDYFSGDRNFGTPRIPTHRLEQLLQQLREILNFFEFANTAEVTPSNLLLIGEQLAALLPRP